MVYNMSKKLLQEYFELCPDGKCALDVLTEAEKRKVIDEGTVYLVGVCQRAGTKNGNGRIYRKQTLQREVENYQKSISERRSLGELDHPDDSVINLKNASHLVAKMWWDGENVMGKIEVLNTPSGQILKDLVKSNVKLNSVSPDAKEFFNIFNPSDLFNSILVPPFFFSFFTFSFCIGLSVWEVKAKIDAMPITITPTKRKVYMLEFLSIKPFLILS